MLLSVARIGMGETMRKITLIAVAAIISLALGGCWGSSATTDPRVGAIIEYVKTNCGWVVEAASVAAMLTAPNPAVAPGVKTLGSAICSTLGSSQAQVQTFLGWGEDKNCPRVNGVCIEAKRDEPGK